MSHKPIQVDRHEVGYNPKSQEDPFEESQRQNGSRYQEQCNASLEWADSDCDPRPFMARNSYQNEVQGTVEARFEGVHQVERLLGARSTLVMNGSPSTSSHTDRLPGQIQLSIAGSSSQRHKSEHSVANSPIADTQTRPRSSGLAQIEEDSGEEDSEGSTPVSIYEDYGFENLASPNTSLGSPPTTQTPGSHSKANMISMVPNASASSLASSSALSLASSSSPDSSTSPYSFAFSRTSYSYSPRNRASHPLPTPPAWPLVNDAKKDNRTAADFAEFGNSPPSFSDSFEMKGSTQLEETANISAPSTFWTPSSATSPRIHIPSNSSVKDGIGESGNASATSNAHRTTSRPSMTEQYRWSHLETQNQLHTYSSSAPRSPDRPPSPYSFAFSRTSYSYIPQNRAPSPPLTLLTPPVRLAVNDAKENNQEVANFTEFRSSPLSFSDSSEMKGSPQLGRTADISAPNTFWTPPSATFPGTRIQPNSNVKDSIDENASGSATSSANDRASSWPGRADQHKSSHLQAPGQPQAYSDARARLSKRILWPSSANSFAPFDNGNKAREHVDTTSSPDADPVSKTTLKQCFTSPLLNPSIKFSTRNPSAIATSSPSTADFYSNSETSSHMPYAYPGGYYTYHNKKPSAKRPVPMSLSHSQVSSNSNSPERGHLPPAEPPLAPPIRVNAPAWERIGAVLSSSPITAISFSPDGNYFASGSKDSNIVVWNVNSETPNGRPLTGHRTEITCIAFSPTDGMFVSSSHDSRLYAYDLKSEMKRQSCFEVGSPVTSIAYSPSGQNLVCGNRNCQVQVWYIKMYSRPLRIYEGHSDTVTFVVYSPNGRLIASASDDLTIKIWSVLTNNNPVTTIQLQEKVAAIRITASNDHIMSAAINGSICAWSVSTGQLISHHTLQGDRPFRCFAFSADGKYLASGSSDQAVRIHAIETGIVISGPYLGHESQIDAIAISPDSKLVVSGDHDASIRTWKIKVFETKENSALEFLDELWGRLEPFSSHETTIQRSEMRDWSKYITRGVFIDGGACGDVYAGKWVNVPSPKTLAPPDVVLKIMRPNIRIVLDQNQSTKQDRKVRRELKVWMKLRHPNIVPFVGVAYGLEEESGSTTCPIMISLRMANGNLKKYLNQNQICDREGFPLQIARGLAYLHQFDPEIVHGDLKAKNVFVDGDGTLKLGDFGLSRMLCDESLWITTTRTAGGTVRWMSPELLDLQPVVKKESDIYAFGMTVFEILSNQVPFAQYVNDAQVLTAVLLRKELPRLKIEGIIERLEGGSQSGIPS